MKKQWVFVISGVLAVILAVIVVLLVTRGGAPTPQPTSSPSSSTAKPSSTPTPSAAPTPSATPTAAPVPTRPALDELVLTSNSLGTLTLGTDPGTYDPTTSIVELTPWDCGGGSSGTAWTPVLASSNSLTYPYGAVVRDDGTVVSISAYDPQIRTDRGARTGMTWAEIAPLYPEAVDTSANADGTVHTLGTAYGTLYFYSERDGAVFTIGLSTHTPSSDFVHVNNHGSYAFCM